MRDDRQRLEDILEASRLIKGFALGKTKESLTTDALLQSAILYQLHVIGEAANRISDSLRTKYPNIPWTPIHGFRNRVAHEYFKLDMDLVWNTIELDIPPLAVEIENIIRIEFSA
ncbi:MAG: hypothetical protein NVS9B14_19780 [Candidatus Acidiferrum sp.]